MGYTNEQQIIADEYNAWAKKELGITREMLLNDPRFQRTRENMAEFKMSQKMVSRITLAISQEFPTVNLKRSENRGKLMKVFHSLLKNDPDNIRGERIVKASELDTLKHFPLSYNGRTPVRMQQRLYASYSINAEFEASETDSSVSYTFDGLDVGDIVYPQGADYMRMKSVIMIADVEDFQNKVKTGDEASAESLRVHSSVLCEGSKEDFVAQIQSSPAGSGVMPVSFSGSSMPSNITDGTRVWVFSSLQFYQTVNGTQYELRDKSANIVVLEGVYEIMPSAG